MVVNPACAGIVGERASTILHSPHPVLLFTVFSVKNDFIETKKVLCHKVYFLSRIKNKPTNNFIGLF